MSGQVKVGNIWKPITGIATKVNGSWINALSGFIKEGSIWKLIYSSGSGTQFAQIGDIIISPNTVLESSDNVPTYSLLVADGSEFDPLIYPLLAEQYPGVLTDPYLPTVSNTGWVDNGTTMYVPDTVDNGVYTVVIEVPEDGTCSVSVSSEANYDFLTVTGADNSQIVRISGTNTSIFDVLVSNSPYTFTYSKDGGASKGDDTAYINSISTIYPVTGEPRIVYSLPNIATVSGSPFPYKVVADYIGV